jgi:hypothetical protein
MGRAKKVRSFHSSADIGVEPRVQLGVVVREPDEIHIVVVDWYWFAGAVELPTAMRAYPTRTASALERTAYLHHSGCRVDPSHPIHDFTQGPPSCVALGHVPPLPATRPWKGCTILTEEAGHASPIEPMSRSSSGLWD